MAEPIPMSASLLLQPWRKITLTALLAAWTVCLVGEVKAETVLEKIQRTGVITAGTREDAVPFGFRQNGQVVGYAVDLLGLIRARAERDLQKPIRLELVPVTPSNRISLVQARTIDIECGATSRTWNRAKFVDFSVPFFLAGTQLLVKAGNPAQGPAALAGQKVGVIKGTTNEGAVLNLRPAVDVVYVPDRDAGVTAVASGKIAAFASDGVLLEGNLKVNNTAENFRIIPPVPIQSEAYACMVPPNQSGWRNLVDITLLSFMEGLVSQQPAPTQLYNRWFGPTGFVPYPEQINIQFFKGILNTQERPPR
ncbi:amino acid ABC transporter substrate-binding protein [Synechococcus sp. PCC 6312]|uniref:amino acid ABC transporter substrate-binding protein n=1 Tax=Synechococcus sp. (strain ATCC 27167 / PCC 6312) TaxID=195253 RepID=UPI0002E9FB45|nr:amino acid ABC transporter substrate-binding protein [Synechococcus sp. PCC 6312]